MRAQSPRAPHRMRQRHRAVPALHATTPGPGGAQAGGKRRPRPTGRGHRAAPSRQRSPRRRGRPRGRTLEGRTFDLGSPRRQQRVPRWPRLPRGTVDAQRAARGVDDDCQPVHRHRWARRAASMSRRAVASPVRPLSTRRAEDDAGRAEAALARPVLDECVGPALPQLLRCSLEGGDPAPGDAADGRDAGDAGRPVDPHGAASALALRAAAVLDGATAEFFSQRIEKADPVVDRHLVTVEDERHGPGAPAKARGPFGSGAGSAQRAGRPKLS